MTTFDLQGYKTLLDRIKRHLIGFQTGGSGIILRHDVDERLDRAVEMAKMEAREGVRSTYFVLDTATYWNYSNIALLHTIRMMQDLGHEVGWHNNAITLWYQTGRSMEDIIRRPLYFLRAYGIEIVGTASHGDPLCHEKGYVNYNVFGFSSPKFPNYRGPVYALSVFDLEYEAYHVGQTKRVSDSHGRWGEGTEEKIDEYFNNPCRLEMLVHPEWWDLNK